MTGLKRTGEWFDIAVPTPTKEQISIQVGCDIEECAETLEALGLDGDAKRLHEVANFFKLSPTLAYNYIEKCDKKALLDSYGDRIVTSIGVTKFLSMDLVGALDEINRSNFSKFENGKAVFNEHGKIKKGAGYFAPQLDEFID